jgi:hypothetical protein
LLRFTNEEDDGMVYELVVSNDNDDKEDGTVDDADDDCRIMLGT